VFASHEGEGAVGDEVSGKEHEVGGHAVDLMDDAFEEVGFRIFVEVDVADLDNAVTVEGSGQTGDGDGPMDYIDLMSCDFAGVERKAGGCGAGPDKKVATGESGRRGRGKAGHVSMIAGSVKLEFTTGSMDRMNAGIDEE
jgi:hypothetical protein